MSSSDDKELTIYGGLCICATGLLLMVILLPLSFGSLREEELGFKKSTVSQVVDFSELYCCGHYHVGPTKKFTKVNRHIHTVDIRQASAWTCPADDTGHCESNVNSTANEIGQTMTSSFSVNFRIFTDIDNVQLAYEKYQFDDSRVRQTVANLATENAKQTPQQYSVQEILNATSDDEPQVVVDVPALAEDIAHFGYELVDVIVTEIAMGEKAQDKFLVQELKRYQDDIIRLQEDANATRRDTQTQVYDIIQQTVQEVKAIEAEADAYVRTLEADLEAYTRHVDISATTYLVEMYKRAFPNATSAEIAELTGTHMYVDSVSSIGASSGGTNAIFMDPESNRIMTQQLTSS